MSLSSGLIPLTKQTIRHNSIDESIENSFDANIDDLLFDSPPKPNKNSKLNKRASIQKQNMEKNFSTKSLNDSFSSDTSFQSDASFPSPANINKNPISISQKLPIKADSNTRNSKFFLTTQDDDSFSIPSSPIIDKKPSAVPLNQEPLIKVSNDIQKTKAAASDFDGILDDNILDDLLNFDSKKDKKDDKLTLKKEVSNESIGSLSRTRSYKSDYGEDFGPILDDSIENVSTKPIIESKVISDGTSRINASLSHESIDVSNSILEVATSHDTKDDTSDVVGFIPSFLDPDRRSRRRRNVSSSFEDNNNEDVNLNAPEIDQSFSAKQSISIHSQQQSDSMEPFRVSLKTTTSPERIGFRSTLTTSNSMKSSVSLPISRFEDTSIGVKPSSINPIENINSNYHISSIVQSQEGMHPIDSRLQNNIDHQIQIRKLEMEINRLIDEGIIKDNKHLQEISELKRRHDDTVEAIKLQHNDQVKQLEQRHQEAIESLKQIHHHELMSLQQRNKDMTILEELTQQIQKSTGSIATIEEQLKAKYQRVEATQVIQLEERERHLKELENQANHRIKDAELETIKLRVILKHLEDMTNNLQRQALDDKLRLQKETSRCEEIQRILEMEHRESNQRFLEEISIAKSRSQEIDISQRNLMDEKKKYQEFVLESERKLENEKREFKRIQLIEDKELTDRKIKVEDEERQLSEFREEVRREVKDLEKRKQQIRKDIYDYELRLQQLKESEKSIQDERDELHELAKQIESVSEGIKKQSSEFESREHNLTMREKYLEQGWKDMQIEAHRCELQSKEIHELESSLHQKHQELMLKQSQLQNASFTRIQSTRQLLSTGFSLGNDQMNTNTNSNSNSNTNTNTNTRNSMHCTYENNDIAPVQLDWIDEFRLRLSQSNGAKVLAMTNLHTTTPNTLYRSSSVIDNEFISKIKQMRGDSHIQSHVDRSLMSILK